MPESTIAPSSSLALKLSLLAGLCIGVSFFFDAPLDAWFLTHRDPTWEGVAKAVSRYGAWHWLMGAAAVGLAVSWWRGRRDWMRLLFAMMVASSIAGLSADCLRGLTGRTRPYADAPQGWYGVRHDSKWLVGKHAYNSFPSGHTSAATAFATVLWLVHRKRGGFLLLGAAAIAVSRLYLRDHHFSDVVAGAFLGVGTAIGVRYYLLAKPAAEPS
jgi:membrane-associated phospholipid phosphatase